MPRAKKAAIITKPDFIVDRVVKEHLTPDQQQAFTNFCSFRPSGLEIQRWIYEQTDGQVTVNVNSAANWYAATFPQGSEAARLKTLAEEFKGLDIDSGMEWLAGKMLTLIANIYDKLDEVDAVEQMDNPAMLIGYLTQLNKFAGAVTANISEKKDRQARIDQEMGGAQRLCDILLNNFKDTTFEGILRDALRGAMIQLETEVKKG